MEKSIVNFFQKKKYIVTKPVLTNDLEFLPDLLAFSNESKYAILIHQVDNISKYNELANAFKFRLIFAYSTLNNEFKFKDIYGNDIEIF